MSLTRPNMSSTEQPSECIYNLIPKEVIKIEKPPRYISKFKPSVVLEQQFNKYAMKTAGPAQVEKPSPKKYLQKHSKEPKLPERKPSRNPKDSVGGLRKPAVPQKNDNPLMGLEVKKDFVKTNATENIMSEPKKPQPTYADTNRGHRQPLENSGLERKYIKKKNYGETPEYLQRRKEEVRRAQEEYEQYVKEQMRQGAMKQLSKEERKAILEGLKKNWEELHHQYQGISVVTDNASKKNRKQRLEVAMKQLENDISLFERHQIIYVANN